MTRSLDDLRRLNDSTQLSLAVAAVVTLGLPWRTDAHDGPTPQSGWAGFDSATNGVGWLLIVGVVVAVLAQVLGRRAADIAAVIVCALAGLLMVIGIGSTTRQTSAEIRSGPVVRAVLLAGCAGSRAYSAQLSRRR